MPPSPDAQQLSSSTDPAQETEAGRVLRRFLTALSPRRYVRSAAWDEHAGCWANRYPAVTPVADANPRRPVAMHLFPAAGGHPRLWAFDFDSSMGGAGAAQAQARDLALLLGTYGLPAVTVASGPSGGRHLWTACEQPLPADLVGRLREVCRTLSRHQAPQGGRFSLSTLDTALWANERTGALRPPGAAHRAGGHAVLMHLDVDEAVGVLSSGGALGGVHRLVAALEKLARSRALGRARTGPVGQQRAAVSGRPLPPSVATSGIGTRRRQIVTGPDGGSPALAGRRPLSEQGKRALRQQLPSAADHSAHAWGVLVSFAAAGRTFDEVIRQVSEEKKSPGLEYFRSSRARAGRQSRGRQETHALLSRQWELAVECAARLSPRTGGDSATSQVVAAEVRELLARMDADTGRWRRPSGPADEAVLHAVALIVLLSGRREVALDVRRGSLLTGFSPQTVNVAIRDRLIPDGWLREVAPADPRRRLARTVALANGHGRRASRHPICVVSTLRSGSDTSGNAPLGLAEHLLARLRACTASGASSLWGTLGHHVHRTLRAVEDGARTRREIQERTGYSRRTVAHHIQVLQDLGLVAAGKRTGCRRTRRSLRAALMASGRPDVAAERAVVFAVDRAVWAWWQAEEQWLKARRGQKPGRPAAETGRGPGRRRYPRTAQGRPDHAHAWRLEAWRLRATAMLERAYSTDDLLSGPLGQCLRLPGTGQAPGSGAGKVRHRLALPHPRSKRLRHVCEEPGDSGLPPTRRTLDTSSTCHTGTLVDACGASSADLHRTVELGSRSGRRDLRTEGESVPTRVQRLTDLGEFLRTRRERIRPDHVGLPAGPRRRTRGLRREEVAVLAGLSPTWYTYLEQGRDIRASSEVVESLARVLQLDEDERKYFYLLAHGRNPPVGTDQPAVSWGTAADRVIGVVRNADQPAYADNLYGDIVAWNDAVTHWYTDFSQLPLGRRNMLWWVFADPLARKRLANWAEDAQDIVARFRLASATRPNDQRFRELAEATWAVSEDFRRWWSAHEVRESHPRVRELRSADGRTRGFELVALRTVECFHSIIFHVPLPGA
jgi:transcriptional regulator with XRE-family HTH domain/DNA-binding transcriptional ArsR family regulator